MRDEDKYSNAALKAINDLAAGLHDGLRGEDLRLRCARVADDLRGTCKI
jgi:hypothetical protein